MASELESWHQNEFLNQLITRNRLQCPIVLPIILTHYVPINIKANWCIKQQNHASFKLHPTHFLQYRNWTPCFEKDNWWRLGLSPATYKAMRPLRWQSPPNSCYLKAKQRVVCRTNVWQTWPKSFPKSTFVSDKGPSAHKKCLTTSRKFYRRRTLLSPKRRWFKWLGNVLHNNLQSHHPTANLWSIQ